MLLAAPCALRAVLGIDSMRVAAVRLHVVHQEQLRLGAGLAQQLLQSVASLQQACITGATVNTRGRVQ